MYETLISRIQNICAEDGSSTAVCFRKESLTYTELLEKIQKFAAFLKAQGVKAGDRVLYSAVSRPMGVAAYLGIQYLGAAAVHIDKNSTAEHALAVYDETEASLFLSEIRGLSPDETHRIVSLKSAYKDEENYEIPVYEMPEPELPAEMIFTSGTTGRPKGVVLSFRAVEAIYRHTREGIGITDQDAVLLPLPLHHSYGLRVLRAVLSAGGKAVLQNGFGFAGDVEKNLKEHGCTGFAAVPVSMEILRTQMQDRFYEIMGQFRYIEIGAGALTLEQRKRLSEKLPDTKLFNTWGSSETGGLLFTDVHAAVAVEGRETTIGAPPADAGVRILDAEGREAGQDHEHPGRMSLRGDMLMSGYWKRPELTEETLHDGWLLTGDMVYRDADGYIFMLGRADDLINVGGEKVSPLEIENIVGEFPAVKECACIGVAETDQGLGQVPALFLAVREGYSEEELVLYLSERMERIKLPHHYCVVEAIPRNRMQKIDRKAIRVLWQEMNG
ncbi:MAG: class I adenylate-forming enzyme family protein [Lachnospiraceae bacterium]|nr:class I adenylate-forming enzyme family protein [Lachnospiraceae bacterium]